VAAAFQRDCIQWERLAGQAAYVQVADGPDAFPATMAVRRPSERPILVDGVFTDSDLQRLVEYVRSGPTPADGGMGISGELPITDIVQMPNGSVRVYTPVNARVGESATLRRTLDGWRVIEVTGGVS
jgi:hypothetical protein